MNASRKNSGGPEKLTPAAGQHEFLCDHIGSGNRLSLSYEPVIRELFAGQYQRIEQDVAARAKILAHRKDLKTNQKKHQTLAQLFLRHVKPAVSSNIP
jgi:hypothetical protein